MSFSEALIEGYVQFLKQIGHLHGDVIYYYDQNPSGNCFLLQIKAFVI